MNLSSHFKLYAVSAIAAIVGLLLGFDTGIISGALLFIEKDFVISTELKELIVSVVLLGAMLGSLSSGRLTDRYGRRRLMLIISALFIVGTLIASFASSVTEILIGRFIIGFAIGSGSYTAPLYIAEVAPPEFRGGLVSLNQLAITIGILCSFIINYTFITVNGSWHWMFGIGLIPASLLGMGMFFLPESPRWLMKQGMQVQATKILQKLRNTRDVFTEIKEIQNSLNQKQASFREIFSPTILPVLFSRRNVGINPTSHWH